MPRFTQDSGSGTKLESDADSLKFPEGGVFCKGADGPDGSLHLEGEGETIDVVREVERSLELVQANLDELSDELAESLPFEAIDDGWRPSAA